VEGGGGDHAGGGGMVGEAHTFRNTLWIERWVEEEGASLRVLKVLMVNPGVGMVPVDSVKSSACVENDLIP
jgi:hypothetical protein